MGDMVRTSGVRFKNIVIPIWLLIFVGAIILSVILALTLNLHFMLTLGILLTVSGLALYLQLYFSQKDHLYHTKILKKRSSQLSQYLTSFSRKISTLEKEYDHAMGVLGQLSSQVLEAQRALAKRETELHKIATHKKTPIASKTTSTLPITKTLSKLRKSKVVVSRKTPVTDIEKELLESYEQFPQKNRKQRIALQRYCARLLQDKDNFFTISQILTTLIQTYEQADELRDTLSLEIKRWIESDPYVIKHTKGTVTKYQLT